MMKKTVVRKSTKKEFKETGKKFVEEVIDMSDEEIAQYQADHEKSQKDLRVNELRAKLLESDFKFTQDYDKTKTAEWENLKKDRQAWRNEIRTLTEDAN